MTLHNDLKHVLRHEAPSVGFANRVMARIEREDNRARRRPIWWRAAAASLILTATVGGWGAHTYLQYRRAVHAKEQVLLALSIAGEKVRYAQKEVRNIGNQ